MMLALVLALPSVQVQVELDSFYALYEHPYLGLPGCAVLDAAPAPRLFLASPGDDPPVGTHLGFYYIELQWDATEQTFVQKYVSPIWDSGILALAVGDVLGAGRPQLLISRLDMRIDIVDPDSHALLNSFPVNNAGQGVGGFLAVEDSDLDGLDEIHLSADRFLTLVYDGMGNLEWSFNPGFTAGYTIAIGQMDADPSMEIATEGGVVLDVATRTVQWNLPASSYQSIASGDLDGDGIEEIVAMEYAKTHAFDVDLRRRKWWIDGGWGHGVEVLVVDLEQDGVSEVLLAAQTGSGMRCLEGPDGRLRWNLSPPNDGANRIQVADFDTDGTREIFHIPGDNTAYPPRLRNAITLAIEWTAPNVHAPIVGPEIGDVDGDGRNELVLAALDFPTQGILPPRARLHVLDPRDLHTLAVSPLLSVPGATVEAIQDIKLRDLNGHGRQVIVVAAGHEGQPLSTQTEAGDLRLYDFLQSQREVRLRWQSLVRDECNQSVDVADLDLDGKPEVIAGRGYRYGLKPHLSYHSIYSGARIANTVKFGVADSRVDELVAEDFDSDGAPEVLCLVSGSGLYLFEPFSLSPDSVALGPYTCLNVDTSFAPPRIYAGTASGEIVEFAYGASGLQVIATRLTSVGSLTGILQTPAGYFWLGAEGHLRLWDPQTGTAMWSSENLGSKTGRWMAWEAARPNSVWTQGNNGLFRYRIR